MTARVETPSGESFYIQKDDTLDIHDSDKLSKLPLVDRQILEQCCIVGEEDGYIIELPEGDPIRVTTESFSNIPRAHRRNPVIFFSAREDTSLEMTGGTIIIPTKSDSL